MLRHDVIPPKPGKPVVVVLHGLGDSKEGWKPVAPMLGLDGWGWCFVQAPDAYGDGWSWYDLVIDRMLVDAKQIARSHQMVVELLEHLEKTYKIPCERVAIMGFSQGCLIALEAVLRHPRPFLAMVGISGWLHRESDWPVGFGAALPHQRILVTHGRWDGVVPIALAQPRIEYLKRLGVPLRWEAYDKEHSLDPEYELPTIRRHLLDAEAAGTHGPAPGAAP